MNPELKIWKIFTPNLRGGKQKNTLTTDQPPSADDEYNVVGNTNKIKVEDFYQEEAEEPEVPEDEPDPYNPVTHSSQLEFVTVKPDQEPEITENDVVITPNPPPLDEEERFIPFENQEIQSNEFSNTLTYDQLKDAIGVLTNIITASPQQQYETAKILYEISNTDMFDFVTSQVSNNAVIEKLFTDNFDSDGVPKIRPKSVSPIDEFDINAFV